MAVFNPIPSVSVINASKVKLGDLSNWRRAKRRSVIIKKDNACNYKDAPTGAIRFNKKDAIVASFCLRITCCYPLADAVDGVARWCHRNVTLTLRAISDSDPIRADRTNEKDQKQGQKTGKQSRLHRHADKSTWLERRNEDLICLTCSIGFWRGGSANQLPA